MNVTESGFKNRQLHMEDYLQMVSAEQKDYAEVFDYSKITEKSGVITEKEIRELKKNMSRSELKEFEKRQKQAEKDRFWDAMIMAELLLNYC